VLDRFAGHSSNQQNNERFVGETARIKLTGKHEKRANIMAIASNDFTVTTAEREEGDQEDQDATSPSPGPRKKKRRLRGHRKAHLLLNTSHSKLVELGQVATDLGGTQFGDKRALISKNLKSQEDSLIQKRSDEFADSMIAKRHTPPTSNVRMRNKGADITPRTRGRMPYNSVVLNQGHETALVMELRYRHIVPYRIGKKQKQSSFTPAFNLTLNEEKGASFERLTFTEKKLLLMADEERLWRMDRLDKNADFVFPVFDFTTFMILHTDEVNFDITNRGD
jgi:hypothetical protein